MQPDHQAEQEYLYMYISVGHLIECEIIYIFHSRLANSFQRDRRIN